MSGAVAAMGSGTITASHLDTQNVTTGASGDGVTQNRKRGFIVASIGSISDGTSNLYAGAAINQAYWDENGGGGVDFCQFQVAGVVANSGWTSITGAGGRVLLRADATFSTGGGKSTWTWSNYGGGVVGNPFTGNPTLYFD